MQELSEISLSSSPKQDTLFTRDKQRYLPIHRAVQDNDLVLVLRMLQQAPSLLLEEDKDGRSLFIFIEQNNSDMLAPIIIALQKVYTPSSCLSFAARRQCYFAVKIVLALNKDSIEFSEQEFASLLQIIQNPYIALYIKNHFNFYSNNACINQLFFMEKREKSDEIENIISIFQHTLELDASSFLPDLIHINRDSELLIPGEEEQKIGCTEEVLLHALCEKKTDLANIYHFINGIYCNKLPALSYLFFHKTTLCGWTPLQWALYLQNAPALAYLHNKTLKKIHSHLENNIKENYFLEKVPDILLQHFQLTIEEGEWVLVFIRNKQAIEITRDVYNLDYMFLNNFFTADEEKQWLQTTFLQITHHPASLVEKKLQEITLTPVLILKAFQEAYLSYDTKRLYFRNRTPENLTNQNCYYMLYDFVCENSGKKKQNSLRHLVIMHLLDMKEEKIQNDTEAMLCINKVQEFLNNFLKKEALEAYQPNKMVPQGVKEALLAVIKTHSFYSIHCPKDITEENYKQHVLSFLKSASSLKQKGIFLRHFFFFPGNLIQEVAVIKFLIPLFIEIMQQALSQKKLITQNNILALS